MNNTVSKKINSTLKFVYSDNNSLSVIFHDNDLLMGVVGEFNENLKELEKITNTSLYSRGNSILIKSTPEQNEITKNAIQFLANQFINNGSIEKKDIISSIDKFMIEEKVKNQNVSDIIKTPKKSVIPRSERQKEYVRALRQSDIVISAGPAGTGKTLMALAAGLTQVLDDRRYTEIIMTRATVSVGEDIGFLPGTEEEKMGPWMGALDDNLEFLAKGDGGNAGEWGRAATNELIRSRIKIKSMNFMRGRTFMNKYVIIDEAQNLTPKQMKTLITRAGPGTKIICMGNLAQIDTPYLTEGSSGLTYAVDRFKGWAHGGHITLARGERSRLADFASDVL